MAEVTDNTEPKESESNEKENDPESRDSPLYWKGQIEAAKHAAEAHWRAAEDAWKEYICESAMSSIGKGTTKDVDTRFPIYWSSVRNIQPALYSRTPTVVASPMLDTLDDDLAALACESAETLGKYLVHKVNFDRVMMAARDDFIHAGKCTVQVEFDSDVETEEKKIRIFPQLGPAPIPAAPPLDMQAGGMPNAPLAAPGTPGDQGSGAGIGQAPGAPTAPGIGGPSAPGAVPQEPVPQVIVGWLDDMGKPIDIQGQEPEEDKEGFFVTQVTETLEDERLKLLPLSYKDVLHTPRARNEDEVTWKSIKCAITKDVVEDMFGPEVADELPYSSKDDTRIEKSQGPSKDTQSVDKTTEIWEIWDKKKKQRLWLPEKADHFITPINFEIKESEEETLDLLKDPYELPCFFPCVPFMLGTTGPDSMYPTPDYVQLRPFILQLHAMLDRYKRVIRSAKVRGIFNANVEELQDLNSSAPLDGDYIGCHDWKAINGEGGLEGNVYHFPTGELAKAAADLSQAIQDFEAKVNEIWGIPDIVRGISDPQETAAAQQEKGHWYSARFSSIQREFQRVCRDAIVLMVDLALKRFSEDRLRTIMGFDFRPPEDQQRFPQIIALLKDTDNRPIRIDIETDSTISFNEDAEVAKRIELSKTMTDGLASIQQVAQGDNDLMVLGLQSLLFVVRGLRNGKVIAEDLSAYIKKLKEPKPPAPEPQDPSVQVAQIGAQAGQQIAQLKAQNELQLKQMDAQIQEAKQAADAIIKQKELEMKAQADQAAMQSDAQVQQLKAQLEQISREADQNLEREKAQFEAQLKLIEQRFDMAIEQTKAKAEVEKAHIDAASKTQQIILSQEQPPEFVADVKGMKEKITALPEVLAAIHNHIHESGKQLVEATIQGHEKLADATRQGHEQLANAVREGQQHQSKKKMVHFMKDADGGKHAMIEEV